MGELRALMLRGTAKNKKVNRLVVVGARDFSKLPLPLKMII